MRIVILSAAVAMSLHMTQMPSSQPGPIGVPQLVSQTGEGGCQALAVRQDIVGRQAVQLMPHLGHPGVEGRFQAAMETYRNILVEGQHRGCGLIDRYLFGESNRWLM